MKSGRSRQGKGRMVDLQTQSELRRRTLRRSGDIGDVPTAGRPAARRRQHGASETEEQTPPRHGVSAHVARHLPAWLPQRRRELAGITMYDGNVDGVLLRIGKSEWSLDHSRRSDAIPQGNQPPRRGNGLRECSTAGGGTARRGGVDGLACPLPLVAPCFEAAKAGCSARVPTPGGLPPVGVSAPGARFRAHGVDLIADPGSTQQPRGGFPSRVAGRRDHAARAGASPRSPRGAPSAAPPFALGARFGGQPVPRLSPWDRHAGTRPRTRPPLAPTLAIFRPAVMADPWKAPAPAWEGARALRTNRAAVADASGFRVRVGVCASRRRRSEGIDPAAGGAPSHSPGAAHVQRPRTGMARSAVPRRTTRPLEVWKRVQSPRLNGCALLGGAAGDA